MKMDAVTGLDLGEHRVVISYPVHPGWLAAFNGVIEARNHGIWNGNFHLTQSSIRAGNGRPADVPIPLKDARIGDILVVVVAGERRMARITKWDLVPSGQPCQAWAYDELTRRCYRCNEVVSTEEGKAHSMPEMVKYAVAFREGWNIGLMGASYIVPSSERVIGLRLTDGLPAGTYGFETLPPGAIIGAYDEPPRALLELARAAGYKVRQEEEGASTTDA